MKQLIALVVCLFVPFAARAAGGPIRPNILFCIADDASPHFGAYGCSWVRTPNIDRLAKQGVVFRNAYTPTAKCAPSRAAILTGRNPWQLEAAANHQSFFPAHYKAFTESLSDAGIYVGAQGKFWGPGEAKTADGKPRTWGLVTSGGGGQADDGGQKFREFLKDRPKDKPFFFWFGSTNPHRPYQPDAGIAAGKKPSEIDRVPGQWPDNDIVRRDMLDYATEIETYDAQIGSLLSVLENSGESKNTLVIITSDHGMPFPRVKGHNYDASNHVPLIAHWPQGLKNPGRNVMDFVSFVDLAPTVLQLLGVTFEESGMAAMTGSAWTDLLADSPNRDRSFVILGRERNDVRARPGTEAGLGYPVRGIREGRLLYLHNFEPDRWPCGNVDLGLLDTDGGPTKSLIESRGEADRCWQFCFGKRPQEELFDLTTDPDCVVNRMSDPSFAAAATKLREKLFAELKRQNDPRVLGHGAVFDNYPTSKPVAAAKTNAKKKAKAKKTVAGDRPDNSR